MVLITVGIPIFIAELTDKDALLILTLATRLKGWVVFAAGSTAFIITSAIIVTAGRFLIDYVPVFWVSIAGGAIMLGYGVWSYFHVQPDGQEAANVEKKLSARSSKGMASVFLSAVSFLVLLDLAGDATEVLTILFVARFGNAFIVFVGAVIALIAATAVETTIGNRLSRILSLSRIRIFSVLVFLTIGTAAILSVLLHV